MTNSGPGQQNVDAANYESLTNSTIIMSEGGTYLKLPVCHPDALGLYVRTGANTIFTQNASTLMVLCGGKKDPEPQQQMFTVEEWHAAGHDIGTTVTERMPSDDEVGQLIKRWLGIK